MLPTWKQNGRVVVKADDGATTSNQPNLKPAESSRFYRNVRGNGDIPDSFPFSDIVHYSQIQNVVSHTFDKKINFSTTNYFLLGISCMLHFQIRNMQILNLSNLKFSFLRFNLTFNLVNSNLNCTLLLNLTFFFLFVWVDFFCCWFFLFCTYAFFI